MMHSLLVGLFDVARIHGPTWALSVAIRWSVRRDYLVLARNLRTPLPEVPAHAALRWRQAGEPEVPDMIDVNPRLTETEIRRRWGEGQECTIGYEGRVAVHYRWEASRPALLPYLGIVFRPLPGDVLVTETYTRRAYRRKGVDTAGSILGLHRAAQRGLSRSLALVAWWNAPSLRTSLERADREVVGTVGYWTVRRRRHVVTGGATLAAGAMHVVRPGEPGPGTPAGPSRAAVISAGSMRASVTRRVHYRELLALAGSREGRTHVAAGLGYRLWPLVWRLAMLHRRTLARRARVVAVVGSYGKTTTARAIAAGLGCRPDPRLELNSFLFAARAIFRVRPQTRRVVVEIGIDGPGQMALYARMLRPDIVTVTSIGSEHNRSLQTIETTRREKAEMLRVLTPAGFAVLNGDDPNVRWMHPCTRARTMTFGFGAGCDVRATDVALDWPRGTTFTLRLPEATRTVRVRLLGRHFVYAALAAVAVARAEGRPLDAVIAAIESLPPTPGRLEPVPLEGDVILVRDEYKSSLETVEAALDVLGEIPARRRIVVLGEVSEPPGSQGPTYRALGARIAGVAARAIFVGGNFQRYAAGATGAGMRRAALVDAGRSVTRAVEALRQDLRPGDVVLIKGRDTQRLDRIALTLMGRRVRCNIESCHLRHTRCSDCALLDRG